MNFLALRKSQISNPKKTAFENSLLLLNLRAALLMASCMTDMKCHIYSGISITKPPNAKGIRNEA